MSRNYKKNLEGTLLVLLGSFIMLTLVTRLTAGTDSTPPTVEQNQLLDGTTGARVPTCRYACCNGPNAPMPIGATCARMKKRN